MAPANCCAAAAAAAAAHVTDDCVALAAACTSTRAAAASAAELPLSLPLLLAPLVHCDLESLRRYECKGLLERQWHLARLQREGEALVQPHKSNDHLLQTPHAQQVRWGGLSSQGLGLRWSGVQHSGFRVQVGWGSGGD